MNFYETKIGHTFFERQVPELIRSIDALATALNRPVQTVTLPVEADLSTEPMPPWRKLCPRIAGKSCKFMKMP